MGKRVAKSDAGSSGLNGFARGRSFKHARLCAHDENLSYRKVAKRTGEFARES
jgi:homogentisate 1,2-dioxygenase